MALGYQDRPTSGMAADMHFSNLGFEDLADAAGLHRTYISSIERQHCNISLDNIEKLAAAFELSVAQLLGDSEEKRGNTEQL